MTEAMLDGLYLLLAEDDPMLGPMVAELFEDEGAEVSGPWVTVRAANLALKTRTPDAALLDVTLKDGDAYPVALTLQTLGVPYAFLSASTPSELPATLHPISFLQKPASRRDVLQLVRRLAAGR